jgi:DNA (cytosine-5)-methyltransferase 1
MRIADLCCGAGGASTGYVRAGHEVAGYDIEPQPHYPYDFLQADVTRLSPQWLAGHFDAVHVSPPCQAYSRTRSMNPGYPFESKYPRLIHAMRALCLRSGLPYIIENVPEAPLIRPVMLCGSMLGCTGRWHGDRVHLRRHRDFEVHGFEVPPLRCRHIGRAVSVVGHGQPGRGRGYGMDPYFAGPGYAQLCRDVMGIHWMNRDELDEAIPPAYTQYVGSFLHASTE